MRGLPFPECSITKYLDRLSPFYSGPTERATTLLRAESPQRLPPRLEVGVGQGPRPCGKGAATSIPMRLVRPDLQCAVEGNQDRQTLRTKATIVRRATTMPTTLQASVRDLANQVARLAQRIDHLLAMAETHQQQAVASKKAPVPPTAERIIETNNVDSKECPLMPLAEEALSRKSRTENVVATSLADLHERLGGFIKTSSPQRRDLPKAEIVRGNRP